MSETHTHSVAYVRDSMMPEQAPPLREAGVVKWLRENLFSTWLNAILTILSLAAIYYVLSSFLPWALGGVWNAGSLTECRQNLSSVGLGAHDGACWAVIRERWLQLLFGFYPADQLWRPILAFALFFVALMPILFSEKTPGFLRYFSAIYPFLAVWLIWGGAFWTPILVALGFVIGYIAFRLAGPIVGLGGGIAVAVVAAALWWLFGYGPVNDGLYRSVGEGRLEQVLQDIPEEIESLGAERDAVEAEQEALTQRIADAVETKDSLLAELEDAGDDATDEMRDAVASQFAGLGLLRDDLRLLGREYLRVDTALSAARQVQRGIGQVEDLEASLPDLREQAATLRSELPDSVSMLLSMDGVAEDTPDEESDLLEAALDAEEEVTRAENTIASTYQGIGLIGLRPIDSNQIGGFMLAIIIGVASIVLSLPLGILLALGRQSDLFIINKFSVAFIETIRGVPLIVWLFTASLLLNYFLPPGSSLDLIVRVIVMVTLFSAAYIAEVVRGGLAALPRGQYEAADALGLDYPRSMRLIVLPQALKISIPGIVNTFIGLFKDTTLVVFVGLQDPLNLSQGIRSDTAWNGIYWELFIFIGVLFFVFCFSMGRYSLFLERKLQREHR